MPLAVSTDPSFAICYLLRICTDKPQSLHVEIIKHRKYALWPLPTSPKEAVLFCRLKKASYDERKCKSIKIETFFVYLKELLKWGLSRNLHHFEV